MERVAAASGPIRIALVNDYDVVLAGIASMLSPYRDRVQVAASAGVVYDDHRVIRWLDVIAVV
jgi:hypothetical protein